MLVRLHGRIVVSSQVVTMYLPFGDNAVTRFAPYLVLLSLIMKCWHSKGLVDLVPSSISS